MEPAETDQPLVPAGPLALATALSGVPVTLLITAFYGPGLFSGDVRDVLESAGLFALSGMGPSCLIGVPIAMALLRDADTSALAWAIAGMATGLISVAAVGFWLFGLSFPMMLFTFLGQALLMISLAAAVLGFISGLVARLLLSVLLGMSRR